MMVLNRKRYVLIRQTGEFRFLEELHITYVAPTGIGLLGSPEPELRNGS